MKNANKKMIIPEKNSRLVDRVLLLSLPIAFIFILLVATQMLPAYLAIISYGLRAESK